MTAKKLLSGTRRFADASSRFSPVIVLFESLHEKRVNSELTWSDIYTFDLGLVDQRPLENLIRKAYDARAKYLSIAGQKEFDEYLASKPPDLTTILVAPNNNTGAIKFQANVLILRAELCRFSVPQARSNGSGWCRSLPR